MQKSGPKRAFIILTAIMAFGLVAAGCGDGQDMSRTNPGAPAGATGSEAGGAAVEAGKQRPSKDVEKEQQTYGEEPPPIQLQTGERSGYKVDEPTALIIRSQRQLRALQKKLKGPGVQTTVAPVQFGSRQVVAVILPKSSQGLLMQVVQVDEKGGKIVIHAVRITRGEGCESHGATNPFALVETRKMKGTPKLTFTTTRNSACN